LRGAGNVAQLSNRVDFPFGGGVVKGGDFCFVAGDERGFCGCIFFVLCSWLSPDSPYPEARWVAMRYP